MQTFELIHDISSSFGIPQKVKAYLFCEISLFDSYFWVNTWYFFILWYTSEGESFVKFIYLIHINMKVWKK